MLMALLVFLVPFAGAQVRPIYDQGAIGLGQILKRLGNTKRIMHIGAHPDDEDSDMLAYLARKENARTVYLSLTRGDGGQNVIGPELFEALGVIRTEELLQARTLDGAEQMFTRAFDYGYSKTLAEAQSKWDEETIKCDVVRAIRSFRPQVVVSRFGGTPRDRHGQHQYAGYIAPIAVRAAADASQCKDAGPVWMVAKYYVGQGFFDTNAPTLQMNSGIYDYLIGRSYNEIATQGRSQHKTQEQGGVELKGDRFSGVNLVESSLVVRGAEDSVFDGEIDYSIEGNLYGVKPTAALQGIDSRIKQLSAKYRPEKAFELVPELTSIAADLDGAIQGIQARLDKRATGIETDAGTEEAVLDMLRQKSVEAKKAIRLASGLQIDAISNTETISNNESLTANVNVFYPEDSGSTVKNIELVVTRGWTVRDTKEAPVVDNSPFARFFRENPRFSKSFSVVVPADQKPTQPYFLERPRDGYFYQLENGGNRPFEPPLVTSRTTVEIGGNEISFEQSLENRYAHDTRGELRRNLNVVPAVSLDLDQPLLVIPQSPKAESRHISLNVKNNSLGPVTGTAKLEVPAGWKISPAENRFSILKKGDKTSFDCEIIIPANTKPGSYVLKAVAETGGKKYSQTMNTIAYEHIQTHRYYTAAETNVAVMDLKVASVKIGYVMGSGDSGADALRQMGLDVEQLDEKQLTNGNLSRFDTIVIGIRASETNPSYVANNQRLLQYVNDGGTMIVQYQKNAFQDLNLAPFPIQIGGRVAEEDAKVVILEPAHRVFNTPNKITQTDFEGWVQERNLYALSGFDERYTPLLEAHDTGEKENKGGMVYARIGKGHYMYTSYAFFRQLPAGVPGSYRLFANIVSLGDKN